MYIWRPFPQEQPGRRDSGDTDGADDQQRGS
jgi:hypothetical protein